jgi:endonuclease YncB( thermonuclease family)
MATFADEHDFKAYPELSNEEMAIFGMMSPHEQITRDFEAVVVKVHDGDTVTLRCDFRDFDFPMRFSSIDAPELNTGAPGEEARDFLKSLIEGEEVTIRIDPKNRIEKWGRLLGDVVIGGQVAGEIMLQQGYAFPFERRREGEIPDMNKTLAVKQWF